MRQWRVGTLSMGLLLVFTGVGLLLSQYDKTVVVDVSLKWWPLIFILLGLEVLLQNYLQSDPSSPLKYDIFSIILILVIVITGLGLQTFSRLGLVDLARTAIMSQVFTIPDSAPIPLEAGVEKIVLTGGENEINIRSCQGNSMIVNSSLYIRAESQSAAETIAGQSPKITQQRAGNTLYVQLQSGHGSHPIVDCRYTLMIPEQVDVEIDGSDSSLNLNLASLQNDWEINGSGVCTVNLPAEADLTVNAWLNSESALHGNLTWTKSKLGPNQTTDNNEANGENLYQAQSRLGKGSHKMNILGINDLTINCLP